MQLAKRVYLVFSLFYAFLIIAISFSYFNPDFSKGFLIGKEEIFHFYKFFLYTHVISAPICFIIAVVQLLAPNLKKHRVLGSVYVILVLFFAAPSGFFMAFYTLGSKVSTISFVLLSLLWFYTTITAYISAIQKKYMRHKTFMTRSYILANSAILLRILMYLNSTFIHSFEKSTYDLMSIFSWLPIILIFELNQKFFK